MPVTNTHPDYDAWLTKWTRCRTAVAGSDAIKDSDDIRTYLPVPNGLTASSPQYIAYKNRAKWFAATARTIEGMEGEVFRNDPTLEAPTKLADTFDDVTLTGMSQIQFMREVLTERLTVGRYGELVEYSEENQQTFSVGYCAENIINWRMTDDLGNQKLSLVVLQEVINDVDNTDEFSHETIVRYRVLKLDDQGKYVVELHTSRGQNDKGQEQFDVEVLEPTIRGERFDFIPFIFYGVGENSPDIEKPPLLDLVDLNIADFRNSADLEHGRHFCGLPMHYLFGAVEYEGDASIPVGSGEVLFSVSPDAKAGIVEFSGQGLGALEKAREENRSEMALLGAKLLEDTKRVGETATALMRRQSGKASVLQAMVEVQDQGHLMSLKWKALWEGITDTGVAVSLNKDYVVAKLEAQEITALVSAMQAGAMSQASLFWNLQQGERIPPDTTLDEEMAAIAEEGVDFNDVPEAAG